VSTLCLWRSNRHEDQQLQQIPPTTATNENIYENGEIKKSDLVYATFDPVAGENPDNGEIPSSSEVPNSDDIIYTEVQSGRVPPPSDTVYANMWRQFTESNAIYLGRVVMTTRRSINTCA